MDFWHGGTRWVGRPEIRPAEKGRYECGPGLYLTTHYLRAKKYTGGGKVTTRVTLSDEVRWLEDARLPMREMVEFLSSTPRIKGRQQLLSDLVDRFDDRGQGLDVLSPVSRLVNLMVNAESLSGQVGIELASWLASKGIDASFHKPGSGAEQWVIVFNPMIIQSHRVVPASAVSLSDYELPGVPARPGPVVRVQQQASAAHEACGAVIALPIGPAMDLMALRERMDVNGDGAISNEAVERMRGMLCQNAPAYGWRVLADVEDPDWFRMLDEAVGMSDQPSQAPGG